MIFHRELLTKILGRYNVVPSGPSTVCESCEVRKDKKQIYIKELSREAMRVRSPLFPSYYNGGGHYLWVSQKRLII